MPTHDDCKKIISKLCFRHGVSPKLVSERLLSSDDKQLMLDGEITLEILDVAIRAWICSGKPNVANGIC